MIAEEYSGVELSKDTTACFQWLSQLEVPPATAVTNDDYPAVDYPAVDYPAVDYPAVDYPVVDYPALLELFGEQTVPHVSHVERTVVPSDIFAPPVSVHDPVAPIEACNPNWLAASPGLQWPQMEDQPLKHLAELQSSLEADNSPSEFRTEDRVVPRRIFKCRYGGCLDKESETTRFTRPEHRNRHEKTVHTSAWSVLYRCWVTGCQSSPFRRSDYLQAHLRNSHGKMSKRKRKYQYVATQDKRSVLYDPRWIGDITSDGIPRRDIEQTSAVRSR